MNLSTDESQASYDSRPDTYEHIATVRGYLLDVVGELIDRAHAHDLSKLRGPERELFDKYTPLLRDTTYGSDQYKAYLKEMGEALAHHYEANRHHPEHFEGGIKDMTLVDVLEMLCDWWAASQRHSTGNIDDSIEMNQKRFGCSDELKQILKNTVSAMRDAG